MVKALMFIRERPEEAADIAFKKIPMGNMSRPIVVEGIRRLRAAMASRSRRHRALRTCWNSSESAKITEDIPPEKV